MRFLLLLLSTLTLVGCFSSPVRSSGGLGSVTVHDSNPDVIIAAARDVFASRGYTPSDSNYPTSVSFDKKAGAFANIMWGSYGDPQSIRVKLKMEPIPGTDDFRLQPRVYTVGDAGEAGFDDPRQLLGLWNLEFSPMLREIARKAGD